MGGQCDKRLCFLNYALQLATKSSFFGVADLLRTRFEVNERKTIVAIASLSLDASDAIECVEAAVSEIHFGLPLPSLTSHVDDAIWWAENASPAELRAYALACFIQMSKNEKQKFIIHLNRRLG